MMKAATLTLNPCLDKTMYFSSEFKAGALNRMNSYILTLGGKGVNVSRFFKILGIDAVAYGFSGGNNGNTMKALLDEEGVRYCFTETKAETRMNLKMIDVNKVCTEANEKGGPISEKELEKLLCDIKANAECGEYFFLGGSIPHPVDNYVYNSITQVLKSMGVKVVLDCDGEALKKGIEAKPSLIKPNLFELSGLVGKEIETVEEKQAVRNDPARLVCVLGEKRKSFQMVCQVGISDTFCLIISSE